LPTIRAGAWESWGANVTLLCLLGWFEISDIFLFRCLTWSVDLLWIVPRFSPTYRLPVGRKLGTFTLLMPEIQGKLFFFFFFKFIYLFIFFNTKNVWLSKEISFWEYCANTVKRVLTLSLLGKNLPVVILVKELMWWVVFLRAANPWSSGENRDQLSYPSCLTNKASLCLQVCMRNLFYFVRSIWLMTDCEIGCTSNRYSYKKLFLISVYISRFYMENFLYAWQGN
jgi:hypothetical protein